ncbi:MAG: GerMN domain-containing protein [Acidimicrobiales bacterium]
MIAPSRRRQVGLVVAAMVVLVGCGVPLDREPRTLAADKVPYQLLEQATTTTSTTTSLAVPTVDVPVYFVLNSRLVEVIRKITQSPSVNKAVNALLNGPEDTEEATGLRTAVSPNLKVEVGKLEAGVVTINLGSEFSKLPRDEQQLALAQLVWTATGIGGVSGVVFTLEGKDIEVVLPDASLASGPVNRGSFAAVGPSAPPP